MTSVIVIHNLSVMRGSSKVLDNVHLHIEPSQLVAITGPNGSGKSTLIKAILGIIPYSGEIKVAAKKVGYLPQSHFIDRNFPISVKEFISLNEAKSIDTLLIEDLLPFIQGFLSKNLADLSQGEFQRALFIRALLGQPDLLVLDEPFSNVDEPSALMMKNYLKKMQSRGVTVLLSIHDAEFVRSQCHQVVVLKNQNQGDLVDICYHDSTSHEGKT